MANRRKLKKHIQAVCGELFADCVAIGMCCQGNDEKLTAIMTQVLETHNDFITRVNHTEKGSERLFYKRLREELAARTAALSEEIIKV